MPQLNAKIVLEIDGQEATIIGSALLDQAARCRDGHRARLNRIIATKVFEARRRHHEVAAAALEQKYLSKEGFVYAEHQHHRAGT